MSSQALLQALTPLLESLSRIDTESPDSSAELAREFPMDGEALRLVRDLVAEGISGGWLMPRGEEGLRYGRLTKATPESFGFSIDAVLMDRPGPGHLHPKGEIDLCLATSGEPLFDGQPEGWVVKSPGSWHIPTVSGGEMAILYFLPDGEIVFGPRP
jgi:hypothetical protein